MSNYSRLQSDAEFEANAVRTEEELLAAVASAGEGDWISVCTGDANIQVPDTAANFSVKNSDIKFGNIGEAFVAGDSDIFIKGKGTIHANVGVKVFAFGKAIVRASKGSEVYAYDDTDIIAHSAIVRAFGRSITVAYGECEVTLSGNALVAAYGTTTVDSVSPDVSITAFEDSKVLVDNYIVTDESGDVTFHLAERLSLKNNATFTVKSDVLVNKK